MAPNEPAAIGPKTLKCIIVTPERAVLEVTADAVVLPMYDGELGVLPGRLPLIGRLGFGELRLTHHHQTHHYYVDGGFAQIRDNVVTVLTSKAIAAQDIAIEAVKQVLHGEHPLATSAEAQDAHQRQQERARAQLRIATKSSETTQAAH